MDYLKRTLFHQHQKLTKIYRAAISNTMETGASYILNSNKNKYQTMNTTINQALRKATGCTKTTPINTLHAITAEIPFNIRNRFIVHKELVIDVVYSPILRQQLQIHQRTKYKKRKKKQFMKNVQKRQ